MSKYKPLSEALSGREDDRWTLKFDELERRLGFALPKAARERMGWWANDDEEPKAHARAWLDEGFRAEALDLRGGEVTFVRHRTIGDVGEPLSAPAAHVGEAAPVTADSPRTTDPTASEAMSAAEKLYERDRAAETAKKVGIVAAALGVLGGAGLLAARLLGRRR